MTFGKAYVSRRFGLWWNYDLSFGLAVEAALRRRGARFYGISIGSVCIGVTVVKFSKAAQEEATDGC